VTLTGPVPTVAAAFAALGKRYPRIHARLVTETGQLRPYVNVFVGAVSIRDTGGLDTPISRGTVLTILPAITCEVEDS